MEVDGRIIWVTWSTSQIWMNWLYVFSNIAARNLMLVTALLESAGLIVNY